VILAGNSTRRHHHEFEPVVAKFNPNGLNSTQHWVLMKYIKQLGAKVTKPPHTHTKRIHGTCGAGGP
jgi:hypothetical protein